MELQWPLILFTTLTAWGCGVLGGAGALALKGAGKKSQQLLAILSCVLLALGGIAVFFHLQHWERIFNGFGHITSGITQELIAIVVFVVVAVAYFVVARKSDDGGTLPRWMAWVAIAVSVVLAAVCAHSYMMPARPAWDSVFEVLSIVGAACLLGPATCAVVLAAKGEETGECGLPAVAGSAIGAVCTAAYAAFIQLSAGAFTEVGYYFDPTHPTKAVADAAATVGAWPGLASDRLWRADSCALVSARQPPSGHRTTTEYPERPLPLGDTLSPNPPCKQGRLQAEGAALRSGAGAWPSARALAPAPFLRLDLPQQPIECVDASYAVVGLLAGVVEGEQRFRVVVAPASEELRPIVMQRFSAPTGIFASRLTVWRCGAISFMRTRAACSWQARP